MGGGEADQMYFMGEEPIQVDNNQECQDICNTGVANNWDNIQEDQSICCMAVDYGFMTMCIGMKGAID